MKTLLLLSLLTSTFCEIVEVEYHDANASHPGYCYTETMGIGAMEKGEYRLLQGLCMSAVCEDNRAIYYSGCGRWKLPPKCTVSPGDTSRPYPDCCPFIDCTRQSKVKKKHKWQNQTEAVKNYIVYEFYIKNR